MKAGLFKKINKYPEILTAISEKRDGLMRIKPCEDEKLNEASHDNRKKILKQLLISEDQLASTLLSHETAIELVAQDDGGKTLKSVDGLLTLDTDIYLSITVADCLPVFLFDTVTKVFGLIHAGWRGLAADILTKAIVVMQRGFGSDAKSIIVGIGPGISVCHFEVGPEVLDKFKEYDSSIFDERGGNTYVNLKKVAQLQLQKVGIMDQNIEVSKECTYCLSDRYFSFRRDKPQYVEPMIAVIGRRSNLKR